MGNKVRIHHLKEELDSCKQDKQTVMDYFGHLFGHLAKMWEELDTYKPLPPCSCSASVIYETKREEEKVHQFVMGLDEAWFEIISQGIIATDSSVDLGGAYARVVREEQLASTKEQEAQHNDVGFVAKKEPSETNKSGQTHRVVTFSHCGRCGHEKDNCWQLVGFPDWWEETPPTRSEN